jgi:hypothetical protein
MAGLFSKTKMPDPAPPAPMPDPEDVLAQRNKARQQGRLISSAAQDSLAQTPGTIGREFSRSTLG